MTSPSAGIAPARQRFAWCMFDFANSAFPTIALTAFGAPFFTVLVGPQGLSVGPYHVSANEAWGLTVSVSMALVTLTSPLMGALADRASKKRLLLAAYVLLCVGATVALGFVRPGQGLAAFGLYVIANFAFEGAYVFYNAFLPELTTPERIGRLSGAGWALGYLGGLLALLIAKPFMPAAYDASHAPGASRVYFVVAGWYLVFSVPALAWLRDRVASVGDAPGRVAAGVRASLTELRKLIVSLPTTPSIMWFLAASFLYNDAITTVIQFTGIYSKDVLHFSPAETVMLFLVLNIIAAPGALVFAQLNDRIGGKRAIAITLVIWIAVVALAALSTTKAQFWGVAVLAAVVLGATQSASRALMAHLAPREKSASYMGLLALSGKASAIFGPTIYGVIATRFDDPSSPGSGQRIAIATIGLAFVVGLVFLARVRDVRAVTVAGPV